MNYTKAYFISSAQTDKILGTFKGSLTAAPGVQTTVDIPTNIPESTFVKGRLSTDGGVTWRSSSSAQNFGPSFVWFATAGSRPNFIKLIVFNFSASPINFLFQVAAIAKPDNTSIQPQPIGSKTFFNSNYNYQKIASDFKQTYSLPNTASQTFTFTHNLGYIPRVATYIDINGEVYETTTYSSSQVTGITTTNVFYTFQNTSGGTVNGKFYARVYYDE